MAVPDLPADPVEPEPVVDRLEEKVSTLIKFLVVIVQLPVGMEWDQYGLCLLILFVFFRLQPCLFPGPCHHAVPVSAECLGKFPESAEFADPFGSAFAAAVYIGLGDVKRF